MIELALVVASAALCAGFGATLLLRLLPTVRLQLAGLALLSATVPLATVLLSGWVMFHMGADVKILAVTTAAKKNWNDSFNTATDHMKRLGHTSSSARPAIDTAAPNWSRTMRYQSSTPAT